MFDNIKNYFQFKIIRRIIFLKQRIFRGFDDSDTWSLDSTIAQFTLPRLKRFKELNISYPGRGEVDTFEKWNEVLDKMIYSLERVADDDWEFKEMKKGESYSQCCGRLDKEKVYEKIQEGLQLFGNYFNHLWW